MAPRAWLRRSVRFVAPLWTVASVVVGAEDGDPTGVMNMPSAGSLAGSCYGLVVADLVDIAPDRCASFVAPVIERLTLAVVNLAIARAAGSSVPSAALADAMRMLGQLRTALLARPVTEEGLAAVYRYRDPVDVHRDVVALLAGGLVERAGDDDLQASDRGRMALTQMYNVSATVADELWAERKGSLAELADLAGRLVHSGLATGGKAYATMAPPYEPLDASAGLLLHSRLSVLRYHRQDAHAAAWQAAGLTSTTIRQLSAGAEREAIEAETNSRDAAPYASLTPDERLAFLAGLGALPG
jgi:hypothetical protein